MMRTAPGADQELLRNIATTARRQRCRTGEWPRRIRIQGITWHLVAAETYTTSTAGSDSEACFTHGADRITPGAAARMQIEKAQLLIV
jgi:hypothetical protein